MSAVEGGYVVLVSITVNTGFGEHFAAAIKANAAQSLSAEPGCWVFDVAADGTGAEFCLYEVYEDKQAFEAHLKSEHFLAFDELTRSWTASKTVKTFERLKP